MVLMLFAWCRENIERDIELERRRAENPDLMEDDVDAVPCISRYSDFLYVNCFRHQENDTKLS